MTLEIFPDRGQLQQESEERISAAQETLRRFRANPWSVDDIIPVVKGLPEEIEIYLSLQSSREHARNTLYRDYANILEKFLPLGDTGIHMLETEVERQIFPDSGFDWEITDMLWGIRDDESARRLTVEAARQRLRIKNPQEQVSVSLMFTSGVESFNIWVTTTNHDETRPNKWLFDLSCNFLKLHSTCPMDPINDPEGPQRPDIYSLQKIGFDYRIGKSLLTVFRKMADRNILKPQ